MYIDVFGQVVRISDAGRYSGSYMQIQANAMTYMQIQE